MTACLGSKDHLIRDCSGTPRTKQPLSSSGEPRSATLAQLPHPPLPIQNPEPLTCTDQAPLPSLDPRSSCSEASCTVPRRLDTSSSSSFRPLAATWTVLPLSFACSLSSLGTG